MNKIYPRPHDKQTVYLKDVITKQNIEVGEYTICNDFVHNPRNFEKNNVLYHYPINGDKLKIGKFCSIACGAKFLFTSGNHSAVAEHCKKQITQNKCKTERSFALEVH